jgi:hypothetical protein
MTMKILRKTGGSLLNLLRSFILLFTKDDEMADMIALFTVMVLVTLISMRILIEICNYLFLLW